MASEHSHPASASFSIEETPVQTEHSRDASRRLSQRAGEIPATVAGYEVLKCLGEGSFGTVWLSRERKTGRLVAIKFFANRRGLDWTLLTREVEKLAVLDASRDVVRLLDVGVDHDPPYFVMEFLPNGSVANLIEASPLTVNQSIEITRSMARALVHAHSAGILHCDIKPGNVLLDRGNEARLGDFGQSRLATDQSASLGTFFYMAPEQAQRKAVPDVRWDVYALGALLYHMLTGAPPYCTPENEARLQAAETLDERLHVYRNIIAISPPPSEHRNVPRIDSALVELIDGCLDRNPASRVRTPQSILDSLESRELARAKRPLIWIGFLGPIVVLLALVLIASRLVPNAVKTAQKQLLKRALVSDMATAQLLASSIQQELLDRQSELERLARRLIPSETEPAEYYGFRSDFQQVIDRWREETDQRFELQQRTKDESVFLIDQDGIQIYRSPWSSSIGNAFKARDYFHGLGRELNPAEDLSQVKPRTTSGVSVAFRSTITNQFMVAIAVPVWNRDNTHVLGVLCRTLHLTDLLLQWEQRINDQPSEMQPRKERLLSLVDMREQTPMLLDHDWIQQPEFKRLSDEGRLKKILQLTEDESRTLREAALAREGISDYRDPLADQDPAYDDVWLAAVARTSKMNWIAIVQERRNEAVAPMAGLYWMFIRYGALMLVVSGSMMISLWWLIQRYSER